MSGLEKAADNQSTPLQRAHALSARASLILRPSQPSSQALSQALDAYRQAADLFEASAAGLEGDEGAKGTLELLTAQHRKMIRDLERRMNSTPRESVLSGSASPSSSRAAPGVSRSPTDHSHAARIAGPTRQKSGSISSQRNDAGVPPFAYRPPHSASVLRPSSGRQAFPGDPTSPLHSSSSSSEAPEESYIHFGAPPDTLDPFSRFWGMLDNMLEDISNPVVFTSAPLDGPRSLPMAGREDNKLPGLGKGKSKANEAATESGHSPTESFYVVPRGKSGDDDHSGLGLVPNTQGPSKTPEELALENSSLRASLDAMASHSHSVEQANQLLKAQLEERDKRLTTALAGVRREAARAKQGQDVWKSQLLAGSTVFNRGVSRLEGSSSGGGGVVTKDASATETLALRKRVKELEDEVQSLRVESEKQKHHIEKYRDRFDKLKSNARAKKEAKLAAAEAAQQNSTSGGKG